MRNRPARSGLTLVELIVVIFIVGVIVLSASIMLTTGLQALVRMREESQAAGLAAGLMEEIVTRRWDHLDGAGSAALGVDTGEVATDKLTFTDIDDFNGYQEAPPRDAAGAVIPGLPGFVREASVSYVVDTGLAASATPTPRKKIVVRVLRDGVEFRRAVTLRVRRLP